MLEFLLFVILTVVTFQVEKVIVGFILIAFTDISQTARIKNILKTATHPLDYLAHTCLVSQTDDTTG